jgi:hypothetical protein
MQNTENNQKKKESNWLGLAIFLLLVVGPNIIRPLSQFIYNLTGGTVNIGMNIIPILIAIVIGFTVIRSIVRAINGRTEQASISYPTTSEKPYSPSSLGMSSDTSLFSPTSLPSSKPQWKSGYSTPTQRKAAHDENWRPAADNTPIDWDNIESLFYNESLDRTRERVEKKKVQWEGLPKPPAFEPVINGKALAVGIFLVILVGGGLMAVGVLNQILPTIVP